jgi:hypothetical protein
MRVLLCPPVIFLMSFLVFYLLESLFGVRSTMRRNQRLSLGIMRFLLERDTLLVMNVIMFSSMGMSIQFLFQNERLGNQHPWCTEECCNEQQDA